MKLICICRASFLQSLSPSPTRGMVYDPAYFGLRERQVPARRPQRQQTAAGNHQGWGRGGGRRKKNGCCLLMSLQQACAPSSCAGTRTDALCAGVVSCTGCTGLLAGQSCWGEDCGRCWGPWGCSQAGGELLWEPLSNTPPPWMGREKSYCHGDR